MKLINIRFKKIFAFLSAMMFVFLCGCNSNKIAYKDFPKTLETVASKNIASNKNLSLEYDNKTQNIFLKDNNSGKIWSAVNGAENSDGEYNSPIYIEYINSKNFIKENIKGLNTTECNVRVSSKNIKDGIELVYYFDEIGISVPVSYVLRESSLAVTVDFNRVYEEEKRLLSVSVAPFFCSVKNNTADSYLVLPTGSGALMYPDERIDGQRNYTGYIYGSDPASLIPENLNEETPIRLPAFGVKDGNDALLSIIEGDSNSYITAAAGNTDTGYSNVFATFYARGYDITDVSDNLVGGVKSDIYQVTESIDKRKVTIAFYSLSSDKANYVGMAEKYREYLQSQDYIKETVSENPYALYITGGAQVDELLLGFSVKKTKALTTFSQAQEIIKDIHKQTGANGSVQLKGFGQSGLTIKKIAGGFKFSSVFGKDSERLSLEKYCEDNKITLFTDFDLIYFSSMCKGYNTLTSAAKSAMHRKIKLYYRDKALWSYDKEGEKYFLMNRSSLESVVKNLKKTVAKKKISNVSLSTLGKTAYSDYAEAQYNSRGKIIEDVEKYINSIKSNGVKVATEEANAYAAVLSDNIFEVPLESGNYNSFDAEIPFYQMVFKGYVPMYSSAVNVTDSIDKTIMLAVQSGTSLGFSVIGEYNYEFANTPYEDLYASSYKGSKEKIVEAIKSNKEYYSAISRQTITAYEYVSSSVTKTTFSNGVTVFANHSDKTCFSPVGDLKPYGFSYSLEVVE